MQIPQKLDMYNATIPILLRGLTNLEKILDKAIAHCTEKGVSDEAALKSHLIFDMRPLDFQIRVTCDTAKGAAARLGGVESPSFEDNETTFAQFKERIAKTKAFIASVPAAGFEGSETREIVLTFGDRKFPFVGYTYLIGFVLPNFYFHISTFYNILRTNGVKLGKADFLGGQD